MSSPSLKVLPTYLNTSQSRLQALYSDVSRQRHSNPSSYHSHVGWWQKTLETLVSRGLQKQPHLESSEQEPNRLILRAGHGLVEELRFPGVGKPLGLGAVIVSRLLFSHYSQSSRMTSKGGASEHQSFNSQHTISPTYTISL